jgi:uncharacterized protein (UPF0548 family)
LTPWRIGRGWSEPELRRQLADLAARPASRAGELSLALPGQPGARPSAELPGQPAPASPWTVQRVQAPLGHEPPGPPLPDSLFARARKAIHGYRFADPRITHGHFDRAAPLLGRNILVEVQVLLIHLLVGLRVGAVLDEADDLETRFGIRLDTLQGHILDGAEWIEIAKDRRTGTVWLRIGARWRQGTMPAWWMGLGFRLFGPTIQVRWRRQALQRLRALAH